MPFEETRPLYPSSRYGTGGNLDIAACHDATVSIFFNCPFLDSIVHCFLLGDPKQWRHEGD